MESSCRYLTDRAIQELSAENLADLELDRRQEVVEHLRVCF